MFLGTVGLVLVVTWGGDNYAWDSYVIIILIILSVGLYVGFVYNELNVEEPILNIRLFRIRNFAVSCFVMFFFWNGFIRCFCIFTILFSISSR